MDQLRAVSDDWLHEKAGGEKGFSLGFFDPGYVQRFPVAVVERQGRIQAFANLWPGAGQARAVGGPDALPQGRARRASWKRSSSTSCAGARSRAIAGSCSGWRRSPASRASPVAPLWTRLGSFLYQHGERLYNFQGLRAYKDKFNPIWEPHYLAYPGGLALPRILADVAALIAGGYRRIFLK